MYDCIGMCTESCMTCIAVLTLHHEWHVLLYSHCTIYETYCCTHTAPWMTCIAVLTLHLVWDVLLYSHCIMYETYCCTHTAPCMRRIAVLTLHHVWDVLLYSHCQTMYSPWQTILPFTSHTCCCMVTIIVGQCGSIQVVGHWVKDEWVTKSVLIKNGSSGICLRNSLPWWQICYFQFHICISWFGLMFWFICIFENNNGWLVFVNVMRKYQPNICYFTQICKWHALNCVVLGVMPIVTPAGSPWHVL